MGAAVDVGGAGLLGLTVLVLNAVAAGGLRLAWPANWRELAERTVARAGALDPAGVSLALGAAVGLVALAGSLALFADRPEFLVINEEQTIPAYFNGAQLYLGGILALAIGLTRRKGEPLWPWLALGALLLALGFDEAAEIHERLESRSGLPAGIVLAPAALAGLVSFLGIFATLRACPPALMLFFLGGAAWALSQALDPIHSVDLKSVIEETLELGGSALFILALHRVARCRQGEAR